MSEVKRYGSIAYLVDAAPKILEIYPSMTVYVMASDFDAAQSELAALREALEHIEKTCGQSRTVTRRLRWIAKRAELALAGRPYVASEHELPANAETEHFRMSRQNTSLRERLAAAEHRNAELVELLREVHKDYRHDISGPLWNRINSALKPTESGASE